MGNSCHATTRYFVPNVASMIMIFLFVVAATAVVHHIPCVAPFEVKIPFGSYLLEDCNNITSRLLIYTSNVSIAVRNSTLNGVIYDMEGHALVLPGVGNISVSIHNSVVRAVPIVSEFVSGLFQLGNTSYSTLYISASVLEHYRFVVESLKGTGTHVMITGNTTIRLTAMPLDAYALSIFTPNYLWSSVMELTDSTVIVSGSNFSLFFCA